MEEKIITIKNEEETRAFGGRLAEEAKPGMVIALIGDLGTGKTTLTKSIAAALGVQGHITSPTFNIVKEYKTGRLPLYHFDVYRITDPDEMYELGYEEYFYGDGVCIIEWADLIEELLPEHTDPDRDPVWRKRRRENLPMYFLAIETTGAFASVALLEDDRVLEHIQGHDRFSHLQNLMPQVKEVLENHKLSINDVETIAVSKGPGYPLRGSGSAYRLRGRSVRCWESREFRCSSLEALAMRAADLQTEDPQSAADASSAKDAPDVLETSDDKTLLCPILDARRSQVYGGGYFLKNGYPVEMVKGGAYTVEEFLAKTEEYDRILLLGDGADAYGETIAEARQEREKITEIAPESIRYQDAVTVGKLGAKLLQEGAGLSYQGLLPDYMRQAEAERKLAEKQAAEAAKRAASKE